LKDANSVTQFHLFETGLLTAKSMTKDTRSGVKSKVSTKFIERIAKLPTWKRLSEKG
jgi:hypothetical protein